MEGRALKNGEEWRSSTNTQLHADNEDLRPGDVNVRNPLSAIRLALPLLFVAPFRAACFAFAMIRYVRRRPGLVNVCTGAPAVCGHHNELV